MRKLLIIVALALAAAALAYPTAAVFMGARSNVDRIGYWSFNEGTGSWAMDTSGNNRNASLVNMNPSGNATSGWNVTDCKSRGCLKFDGYNDYAYVSDVIPVPSGFTVLLWWKRAGNPGGATLATYHQIMTRINGGGAGNQILVDDSGTPLAVQIVTDGLPRTAYVAMPIAGWSQIGSMWNGTHLFGIVNGTLSTPVAAPGVLQTGTANLLIGWRDSLNLISNGTMDEIMMFDRALSAEEISALYSSGRSGGGIALSGAGRMVLKRASGYVGWWNFNEGAGSYANDTSGNGNTGTLTNMNTTGNATSGWTTECRYGSCLKFDGVNDRVAISDANGVYEFNGTKPFSVSFAYKIAVNETPRTEWLRFTDNERYAPTRDGWHVYLHRYDNRVYFERYVNSVGGAVGTGVITLGEWHYFAGVYNGTHVMAYSDGTQSGILSDVKSIPDIATSFTIGSTSIASSFLNGTIDEVMIFDRALSELEIAQLYAGRLP